MIVPSITDQPADGAPVPTGSTALSAAAAALHALSHPTRLAILNAVVDGNKRSPVALGDLVAGLGMDVRTLSKEIIRLIEAGLITREDGRLTATVARLGGLADSVVEATAMFQVIPPESPLRRYLTRGRVTTLPKRQDDLEAIAVALASLLPDDRELTEAEVNGRLEQAGDDVARLRRLLVDLGLVVRRGAADYRRLMAAS